jgi:hypothetical protein
MNQQQRRTASFRLFGISIAAIILAAISFISQPILPSISSFLFATFLVLVGVSIISLVLAITSLARSFLTNESKESTLSNQQLNPTITGSTFAVMVLIFFSSIYHIPQKLVLLMLSAYNYIGSIGLAILFLIVFFIFKASKK